MGRELAMRHDASYHGLRGESSTLRKEKEEEKGDTRKRLIELAAFALFGFGLFKTSIGTGRIAKIDAPPRYANPPPIETSIGGMDLEFR